MRILVTGGAGFVGSHVVDDLVAAGHEVRVVDALLPDAHPDGRPSFDERVEFVAGDLADADVSDRAVAGVAGVTHQASMVGLGVDFGDVERYVWNNDQATAGLLGALHRSGFGGRLVLASSMVVYGEGRYVCAEHGVVRPRARSAAQLDADRWEPTCDRCGGPLTAEPVTESAVVDPRNVYAATKLHQEHLLAAFEREHDGVSVAALRYHNVYGPRMPRDTPYAGVASIFRSALERGEAPRVFEDGGQQRDFVHVVDVARANRLALEADAGATGPFNIATGDPHTVLEMAAALAAAFGGPAPEVVGGYRLGDVRHVFAAPDRARSELGFTAAIGLEEGMEEFAEAPLR